MQRALLACHFVNHLFCLLLTPHEIPLAAQQLSVSHTLVLNNITVYTNSLFSLTFFFFFWSITSLTGHQQAMHQDRQCQRVWWRGECRVWDCVRADWLQVPRLQLPVQEWQPHSGSPCGAALCSQGGGKRLLTSLLSPVCVPSPLWIFFLAWKFRERLEICGNV